MFVAKIKGIALAIGTMSAFVSGAVVLAQGQAGPGDGRTQAVPLPVAPSAETKVERKFDAEERTAALEKKLDRILEALERMSGREPGGRGSSVSAPVAPPAEVIQDNTLPGPDTVPTAFVPNQPAQPRGPEAPMPPQASPGIEPAQPKAPGAPMPP